MTFLDFFAGVGGFRRGMELAGHKCVGFCEWDKYATASYTSMHLITEEQRGYLSTLPLKQRQKEILKDEYRNGEWYSNDIRSVDAECMPRADCWCFGAPCQDFSIAGKRAGLGGDRSSLVREVFRLLEELEEEDRPEWLIYENVKGMFSSNRGLDYLSILSEMDRGGYDAEWQNINSAWFVPQNRERIYTVGHLRSRGRAKVFPVQGADGENRVCEQIGQLYGTDVEPNPQAGRVYGADGVSTTLDTCQGGNRMMKIAKPIIIDNSMKGFEGGCRVYENTVPTLTSREYKEPRCVGVAVDDASFIDFQSGGGIQMTDKARCLQSRYQKGYSKHKAEVSGVAIPVFPVLTPDRMEKRQNGRRMKDDGEPAFTLTAQDRHGVAIGIDDLYAGRKPRFTVGRAPTLRGERNGVKVAVGVMPERQEHPGLYVDLPNGVKAYAVWYEKNQCYIVVRKLTPRECFRLQGWTDDYFEKAQFVNSDSQLYKQAGNGVTVPVVRAVAERLRREHGRPKSSI